MLSLWFLASLISPIHVGVFTVRFGLDSKNQPNRISVFLININQTGPETGSNRTGPVKSGFFWKKPGNLIPSSYMDFVFSFFFKKIGLALH